MSPSEPYDQTVPAQSGQSAQYAQQSYTPPDMSAYAGASTAGYGQPPYAAPSTPYGASYGAGANPGAQPTYAPPQPSYGYGTQPPYAGAPTPQYGYGAGPYGYTAAPAGTKSKMAAGLLGIFLGAFGVHNFYLGYTGKAIAQLLLTLFGWILIGLGPLAASIWGLVEGILILCSKPGSPWHQDSQGFELQE